MLTCAACVQSRRARGRRAESAGLCLGTTVLDPKALLRLLAASRMDATPRRDRGVILWRDFGLLECGGALLEVSRAEGRRRRSEWWDGSEQCRNAELVAAFCSEIKEGGKREGGHFCAAGIGDVARLMGWMRVGERASERASVLVVGRRQQRQQSCRGQVCLACWIVVAP